MAFFKKIKELIVPKKDEILSTAQKREKLGIPTFPAGELEQLRGYFADRKFSNVITKDQLLVWSLTFSDASDTYRFLSEGADPNATHPNGYSVIQYARAMGHTKQCKLLLDFGAVEPELNTPKPTGR